MRSVSSSRTLGTSESDDLVKFETQDSQPTPRRSSRRKCPTWKCSPGNSGKRRKKSLNGVPSTLPVKYPNPSPQQGQTPFILETESLAPQFGQFVVKAGTVISQSEQSVLEPGTSEQQSDTFVLQPVTCVSQPEVLTQKAETCVTKSGTSQPVTTARQPFEPQRLPVVSVIPENKTYQPMLKKLENEDRPIEEDADSDLDDYDITPSATKSQPEVLTQRAETSVLKPKIIIPRSENTVTKYWTSEPQPETSAPQPLEPQDLPAVSVIPGNKMYHLAKSDNKDSPIEENAESDVDDCDSYDDDNNVRRVDASNLDGPHSVKMASDYPTDLPKDLDEEVIVKIQEKGTAEDEVIKSVLPAESTSFVWSQQPEAFQSRRENFTGPSGPTFPLNDLTCPSDAFLKIWDDEILDLIIKETNLYAERFLKRTELKLNSRFRTWAPMKREDLFRFFAVLMVQGLYPLTVEQHYWYNSFSSAEMPHFKNIMSYNRYLQIKKCLHFTSVSPQSLSPEQIKLYKIQPILDHTAKKFAALYLPDQNIALDESLLKWMGQLSFVKQLTDKASEVGIMSHELCESRTGYLWSFEIYTRKEGEEPGLNNEPKGATARIVYNLARPLFHRGHTLIMDNFHNSPLLSRCLKKKGIDSIGTFRINRKFVPESFKNTKRHDLLVGELKASYCEDMTAILWRDKALVSLISTYHPVEFCTVKSTHGVSKHKPKVVLDYNMAMGGVGKKDQLLSAVPIERVRSQVWYKKLFRRILNVSILNACILYRCKPGNSNLSARKFREWLVLDLLERCNLVGPFITVSVREVVHVRRGTYRPILEGNHFLEETDQSRARCIWCSLKGRDSRTKKRCDVCLVPLCANFCFKDYHTKK